MKKHLNYYSLIVILGFIISSCQKEYNTGLMDHTIAQGKLVDAYSGEPIENGTVYLSKGSPGWAVYDSVITGADGRYYFKYDHNLNPIADIWAKADGYLDNRNVAAWSAHYDPGATPRRGVRAHGRVNGLTVRLPPIGWVKYHFKNVNNLEGSFEIRFSPYDSWGVVSWSGLNLDRTYTSIYPSGVDFEIGYAILRNGALYKQHYDTLFIPHKDTLTYYVEF